MTYHRSALSRRTFLTHTVGSVAGAGILGASTATATVRAQAPTRGDWTQYRADAGNTAHLPDGVGPTETVQQAWQIENGSVRDSVAIVDETVYVGGTSLVALNAGDGSKRWELTPTWPTQHPDAITGRDVGPPAVKDGTVYATVELDTEMGFIGEIIGEALVAVDAATGTQRWQMTGYGGVPLTLIGDTLLTIGSPSGEQERSHLYGVGLDGSVRWHYPIDNLFPGTIPAAEGRVYVSGTKESEQSGVQALDMATGEVIWTAVSDVSFDSTQRAMVADGTLFVVEANKPGVTLIALDARTGTEHWRTAYATKALGLTAAVGPETIYIQVAGITPDVIALNRATGQEQWRTHIDQPATTSYIPTNGLALVGGRLYVGTNCLHPDDGSVLWTKSFSTPDDGDSKLHVYKELQAVAGGRMYVLEQRARGERQLPDRLLSFTATNKQSPSTPPKTTTQTPDTPPPTTSSPQSTSPQTAHQPPTDLSTRTQSESTQSATTTSVMPTQTDTDAPQTTATNGPGFGMIPALGGLGLGVWRYLRRE
jgi:outer membrane protein assembly factor BamB